MIYLDHNATTPVLPEIFEAMRPYFFEEWGDIRFSLGLENTAAEFRPALAAARPCVATLGGVR